MADITITIQAASDAIMSRNNLPGELTSFGGSFELEEGDARRVYGLPNFYIDTSNKNAHVLQHATSPRWDTVDPMAYNSTTLSSSVPKYMEAGTDPYTGILIYTRNRPTTTAFQLRCEQISHEFTDNVSVIPMPASDVRIGKDPATGTPSQLNNIVIAIGMRIETIKLSGILVDRGLVTAANPRKQILQNIARMQHFKLARGSKVDGWGGKNSNALNPNSYPCLSIYDTLVSPGFSIGREPSGDSRIYRGIIKDLSFRMEGGRVDIWEWDMTFAVINNEHSPNPLAKVPWTGNINRTRLVDDNDGSASEVGTDENGYIELRIDKDFEVFKPIGSDNKTDELEDGDTVYIEGTTSVPTVNGNWVITGVNKDNRTFIIKKPHSEHFGENIISRHVNSTNAGGNDDQLKWNEANFTAATNGVVVWKHNE